MSLGRGSPVCVLYALPSAVIMFAVFDAEALAGAGVADGVDIVVGQCKGVARRVTRVAAPWSCTTSTCQIVGGRAQLLLPGSVA